MNQQNMRTERGTESGASGIAAKSHDAAEQLKQTLVDQAEQVRERAESAKEQAAERIRRVGNELKNVGNTLRDGDQIAAGVADRAGRSVERLASYVSTTDAQAFVRDAEQLARRQPALFFGGAFLLGLAAGRFLKSSRPESDFNRYESQRALGQNQPFESNRLERNRLQSNPLQGNRVVPTPPRQAYSPAGERVGGTPSPDRFKSNYDATFGRDVESERRTGSEAGISTAGASSTPTKTGFKASENGGGQSGKGSAP